MSLYKTEFPNYDDELIIPEGFRDCSYHNDVCPCVCQYFSKGDTEIKIIIWQDYKDPDNREYPSASRFAFNIQVNGEDVFLYTTDDWQKVEEMLPCLMVKDLRNWKNELMGDEYV